MRAPKVSIVIPVYNVEKYLRQCLGSVVNQTLKEIEIICVDDGSTDSSPAILAEYAAKDPRVRVLTREKSNAGAARNAGMAVATGEYLGFVDSDDWCELTLFEKAYAKAQLDRADLVLWRYRQYMDQKRQDGPANQFPEQVLSLKPGFTARDVRGAVFSVFPFAPWVRLCRSEFIKERGLRFQEITRSNDVLFACLTLVHAARISLLDVELYHYRTGTGTSLQANNGITPDAVVQAWKGVSDALSREGLLEVYRAALATSSANSLFYTLNTIQDVAAFDRLWKILKDLYSNDPLYRVVTEKHIFNSQTATMVSLLRQSETSVEFLLKLNRYRQKIISELFWAKEAALREARTRTRIWGRIKKGMVRCWRQISG